jgi:hypothetical protein
VYNILLWWITPGLLLGRDMELLYGLLYNNYFIVPNYGKQSFSTCLWSLITLLESPFAGYLSES